MLNKQPYQEYKNTSSTHMLRLSTNNFLLVLNFYLFSSALRIPTRQLARDCHPKGHIRGLWIPMGFIFASGRSPPHGVNGYACGHARSSALGDGPRWLARTMLVLASTTFNGLKTSCPRTTARAIIVYVKCIMILNCTSKK